MRVRHGCILLLPWIALLGGCARPEKIPTYPEMSVPESLKLIAERSRKMKDISGEGAITLTDSRKQSIRLDAAFVFAPPDRARVRAWKMGQAVLDLTVLPDGAWLYLPRQNGRADRLRTASSDTGRAAREWLAVLADGFDERDAHVRESGSQLVMSRPVKEGQSLVVFVDRKTLTPRRYEMRDPHDRERFVVTLEQYRAVGDIVWPTRIEATSDSGVVRIDMRDVELNVAPPTAFDPPARAERLP